MDSAQKHAINLSVLKRYDNSITNIIESSSHVVVYSFEPSLQTWKKRGIEGTMFIFKRTKEPNTGFLVMNRLAPDNLIVYITSNMEIEITKDFVIYKTADDDVNGLWIYEAKDRERVGKLLQALQEEVKQKSKLLKTSPSQQSNTDIMSLLQKAKMDRQQIQVTSATALKTEPIQTTTTPFYTLPLTQPILQIQPQIYQPPPIPINTSIPFISSSPQYVITSPQPPQSQLSQLQLAQPIAPQSLPMSFHSLEDIWAWCNYMSGTSMNRKLQRYEFQNLILHLVKNDPNFLNALYEAYLNG
jgi:mRNA-decapping enzyme 1B